MGKKIFIVDDNLHSRNQIKKVVQALGHEIYAESSHGQAVLQLFSNKNPDMVYPDIIILDIVLPDQNGLSVLRQLVSMSRGIKVIMCSSSNNEAFVKQALLEGAYAYLTKPLTEKALKKELDSL